MQTKWPRSSWYVTVFGSLSHYHLFLFLFWAEQELCLGDGLSSKESVSVCVRGLQGIEIRLGQSDHPLLLVCLHPHLGRPFSQAFGTPYAEQTLGWIVPLLLFQPLM